MDRREQIKMAIYRDITPVSEVGGKALMQAIDRMTTSILALIDKPEPPDFKTGLSKALDDIDKLGFKKFVASKSKPDRVETITKILEKWFNDPINTPCAYCEAAKEIAQLTQPVVKLPRLKALQPPKGEYIHPKSLQVAADAQYDLIRHALEAAGIKVEGE